MLKGKNVIVTGTTRGIGREIALTLAQNGANIAMNYRNLNSEVEDLINQIKNKPEHFIKQVDKFVSERTGIKNMKFNAIVGNPPYQVMDGGAQASSVPVYQYFVSIAKKVQPNFISMIMPARWYAGGRGLDDFRADMLSDKTIRSLHDYPKASDLFSNVGSKVDYAIS